MRASRSVLAVAFVAGALITTVALPTATAEPSAERRVSHGASTDKEQHGRTPSRLPGQQRAEQQRPSSPAETTRLLAAESEDAPPGSTWAGTASIASANTTFTEADGDLWPSCWAKNDSIYAAWGDGAGFDLDSGFVDVGVARIDGDDPAALTGSNLATADEIVKRWAPSGTTRKPTGMVCVGDTLYLAVQDLAGNFNKAEQATIVKSTDGGKTWTYDHDKPMFDDHQFTTVWFADFGRGGAWDPTKYVYAYGIDGNWRNSTTDEVPDPQDLYLARVPKTKIQQRSAWQFFAGFRRDQVTPTWEKSIKDRVPVLHDGRRDIPRSFIDADWQNSSIISQGGVTYDKPLNRYLYTSWSEWEHHFYESPTPWGPWKRLLDHNYTVYDTAPQQYAGYAATVPSKFLSDDGLTVMVQSNRCCSLPNAHVAYNFSMRPLALDLHAGGIANPSPDGSNLATDPSTVAVSDSSRQGSLAELNDGDVSGSVDDFDGEAKSASWWGYTWPQDHVINQVTLTTGTPADDGGWFITRPTAEYRRDGEWHTIPIPQQTITPAFEPGKDFGDHATYTITFDPVTADGIRIVAAPGGDHTYSSMSELEPTWTPGPEPVEGP
ncbi:DUF4185 domain-containing protein [Microlunatus soli]|uniref:DUF4185 domain-containing protein n=1 Tax=Microlunatus soli TaxID=630515 RepID=A0A1H1U0H4_9ACTN|nr:DUF4185 domain-containing protein [Microlunatus soli]SDS65933.1 protein of unknown function [Microlunatus soli]